MNFKRGDRVVVYRKTTSIFGRRDTLWAGEMDATIGMVGEVVDVQVYEDFAGITYQIQVSLENGERWWYRPAQLKYYREEEAELYTPEEVEAIRGVICNRVKCLVITHDETFTERMKKELIGSVVVVDHTLKNTVAINSNVTTYLVNKKSLYPVRDLQGDRGYIRYRGEWKLVVAIGDRGGLLSGGVVVDTGEVVYFSHNFVISPEHYELFIQGNLKKPNKKKNEYNLIDKEVEQGDLVMALKTYDWFEAPMRNMKTPEVVLSVIKEDGVAKVGKFYYPLDCLGVVEEK